MSKELRSYLEKEFNLSNHSKYRKHFSEWVDNITDNQIAHFNRMRLSGNIYNSTNAGIVL